MDKNHGPFWRHCTILNSTVSNSYDGMLMGQISMYLPPKHPIAIWLGTWNNRIQNGDIDSNEGTHGHAVRQKNGRKFPWHSGHSPIRGSSPCEEGLIIRFSDIAMLLNKKYTRKGWWNMRQALKWSYDKNSVFGDTRRFQWLQTPPTPII